MKCISAAYYFPSKKIGSQVYKDIEKVIILKGTLYIHNTLVNAPRSLKKLRVQNIKLKVIGMESIVRAGILYYATILLLSSENLIFWTHVEFIAWKPLLIYWKVLGDCSLLVRDTSQTSLTCLAMGLAEKYLPGNFSGNHSGENLMEGGKQQEIIKLIYSGWVTPEVELAL